MSPNLSWPSERQWISAATIRQEFNSGKFWERVKAGELRQEKLRESHPNPTPIGEPYCTWSQVLVYWTLDGSLVALVHQYLRPDGTIGASGRPDPKVLVAKGRALAVRAKH